MTDYSDAIVAEYLRRLDFAAVGLQPDRRAELVSEISEHIAHARTSGEVHDEAGLRDLLDRLGEPDDIVAEARESDPDAPPPPNGAGLGSTVVHYRKPGIGLEVAAILLMTVASIIPLIAWTLGAVMLWTSRRLRTWEKALMTLVVPGGPFAVVYLVGLFPSQVCSSSSTSDGSGNVIQSATTCSGFAFPPWLGIPLLVVSLVAPFVIGGVLIKRASDRAALEPGIPVMVPVAGPGSPGASRWGALEIAAVLLLSVGSFVLPVVGPVAGLVCAWLSPAWTTSEKWVATAICSLLVLVPLAGLVAVNV
jgi:hypothetical protein